MPKIMLIDAAQPEETRVAVMDGRRLDNFDIESASKKQLKGNIYLAKVTRVEPSLQAAFVSYGGNRHGFLPFAEIHPDYYRIPVEDRERLIAEQEELSRQIQAEAKAREERELAEAEARANNPEQEPEEDVSASAAILDEVQAEAEADAAAPVEPVVAEAQTAEAQEAPVSSAEADASLEEDGADDMDDEAAIEGDESEDDAFEGEADGETAATSEEGTEEGASQPAGEGNEGGENGGRFGRRGRRRRGRGRNRDRNRGLERKPDQIVDRESGSAGEEEEIGMAALWKRMHRSYKIQEVIKRGQIMLIQVVKEERGNKGAAVTTYITMPGRYCVLMPNSPQSGGVSRKVSSHADRRKMRDLLEELQVPQGMSVILRTAGVDRAPEEVKRDLDYLMRLWDKVRDTTMQSTAPALIHEEGSLVKRAVRDLFSSDISEIVVEGTEAAATARDMMSMMMPERESVIREYKDAVPLFIKYGAEPQIDAIHSNTVTLRSGGYLVINPTEALVSIDINSGRATRERHIEETALKTNLEAADEIARQLRLRDLGGLVVIDFIDMENRRNNAMVEKRMRDALSGDRARVQVGRISSFGLMELSRQRLRPSLTETHFHTCPHCRGLGIMRTTEAMALAVLRAIETVGMEGRASEVQITVTEPVATFLFNAKRTTLSTLEKRYDLSVVLKMAHVVENDQGFQLEVTRGRRAERIGAIDSMVEGDLSEDDIDTGAEFAQDDESEQQPESNASGFEMQQRGSREGNRDGNREGGRDGRRRRGRRGGRNRFRDRDGQNGGQPFEGGNHNGDDAEIDDNIGNRKTEADEDDFVDGNAIDQNQQREADGNRAPRERNREGNRDGNREGGRGRNRDRNSRRRGGRNRDDRANAETPHDGAPEAASAPAPKPQDVETVYSSTRTAPAQPAPREEGQQESRSYEVVNEVKGDKKKGWWKKLTG